MKSVGFLSRIILMLLAYSVSLAHFEGAVGLDHANQVSSQFPIVMGTCLLCD